MSDSNRIRLRDHWWYFNYRWHHWRLNRAAKAMAVHATILHKTYGLEPEDLKIKVRI